MTIFGQNINSIVGTIYLRKKMVYMKDDKSNLNIIIYDYFIKISLTSCEILGLEEFFWRSCFSYAFLKACQYVTTNDFCLQSLQIYVYTKFAHGTCGSV
jgi:hypothetical protein